MSSLFNFSFQDSTGFLVAFIPALIELILVIYILFFLPQNRTTRVFVLLTLSAALWQLDGAVKRIVVSAQAADTWDCIFSAAWIFIGPLSLHFSLLYSGIMKASKSTIPIVLIYLPAFIFMGIYGSHLYDHVFRYSPFWGWVNYHNRSLIDIMQICWISGLGFSANVLLFYNTWKVRKDVQLRQQSFLIAMGISVPTLIGIGTQAIFPLFLHRPSIPLAATFITVFSFATVLALTKYKLFSVPELISSEALIEALPVLIFSVSAQKRLTFMNTYCADLLGIKKVELAGVKFWELFRHESAEAEEDFTDAWNKAVQGEEAEILESGLNTPKGKIDIILSLKPIINNNQVYGVLFTARDITQLKEI
ncbi:MAG TPA: PAS domain-containing protein, partial [Chitinophagaceae bacterium]